MLASTAASALKSAGHTTRGLVASSLGRTYGTHSGIVQNFEPNRGYGYIHVDATGEAVFFHHSEIKSKGYRDVYQGEQVEFDLVQTKKGTQATNVTLPGGTFVPPRPTPKWARVLLPSRRQHRYPFTFYKKSENQEDKQN